MCFIDSMRYWMKEWASDLTGDFGTQTKINLTADGLHLNDTILWFDSQHTGDLSFISEANTGSGRLNPKIIATEVTIKMLEANRVRPKALVCQYNRPFSVGKLKMELLPSGSILGGAALHVEIDRNTDLLYAPRVLSQRNNTVRQLQLKQAKILILSANHPDPTAVLPNRRREKERLLQTTKQYLKESQFPVILCQSMPTAQEITALLTEAGIPICVHANIFRVNRIYEQFGSQLGPYTLYRPKKKRSKTLIIPARKNGRKAATIPEGPLLYIEDAKHPSFEPEAFRAIAERFYINSTSDIKELKDVIHQVNPETVYFFGPYAKRYVEALSGFGPKVLPLYPNGQTALF